MKDEGKDISESLQHWTSRTRMAQSPRKANLSGLFLASFKELAWFADINLVKARSQAPITSKEQKRHLLWPPYLLWKAWG